MVDFLNFLVLFQVKLKSGRMLSIHQLQTKLYFSARSSFRRARRLHWHSGQDVGERSKWVMAKQPKKHPSTSVDEPHRWVLRSTYPESSNLRLIADRLMESGRITPVKAPPILFSRMTNGNQLKEDPTFCWHSQYPTSFCNQIYVLLKRTFLLNSRDRTLTYSRLTTHFGIALFIGVLYHGIGEDASNILNNFNFLFFTVMFLMLTAFNCVTTTCKTIKLSRWRCN